MTLPSYLQFSLFSDHEKQAKLRQMLRLFFFLKIINTFNLQPKINLIKISATSFFSERTLKFSKENQVICYFLKIQIGQFKALVTNKIKTYFNYLRYCRNLTILTVSISPHIAPLKKLHINYSTFF